MVILPKNAGTPVDQIERFNARNLPLSKEMAINFQSCGSVSRRSTQEYAKLTEAASDGAPSLTSKNE
jgi:hypothetical protein